MYIMKCTIVCEKKMKQVSWKPQSTMIIDGFDGGEREEDGGNTRTHSRDGDGDGSGHAVGEEALKRVVVQRPKCVWDNKRVMLRVNVLVQEFVDVHQPMGEILTCIEHHHGNKNLKNEYHHGRLLRRVGTIVALDLYSSMEQYRYC